MNAIELNLKVKKSLRIRAFQMYFIIVGIQVGVGILGTPRYIFNQSQQDAWLSILIAFIYMILLVWTMFVILGQYENADIFSIQVDLFGKWIGKALGTIYILFFMAELLSVLISYIQIVHVFLFPTMPSYIMAFLLIFLATYAVLGGIRVVVGTVFLFSLLSPWILVLLYDPITRMEWSHFLPLFDASMIELLKGARTTAYSFFGLEILFIIYPFIDNKKNAKIPTFLALCTSTLLVLVTTIISIGYYSPNDFNLMDWPVLSLFKSVAFSFMERFDYLVIAEWMMVILPMMALLMWMITHGTKRLYGISQKKTLYLVSILLIIIASLFNTDYQIEKYTDLIARFGFWLVFVYPIILLPIVLFKKKREKRKEGQHS